MANGKRTLTGSISSGQNPSVQGDFGGTANVFDRLHVGHP